MPAAIFQSINAFFIIVFATSIAYFWSNWAKKGRESSSLFKMAVGLIIMAFGFFFMSKASTEVIMEGDQIVQKSAMIWLVLAYLFHTIGELCASPVALSFIALTVSAKWFAPPSFRSSLFTDVNTAYFKFICAIDFATLMGSSGSN